MSHPRHSEMVTSGSSMQGRLLLLVGARRSGTNWVERILTTHPAIVAMPTETYLFSHGAQALQDLVQHTSPGSRSVGKTYMDPEDFRSASRELMDRILLGTLERIGPNAAYLLERTPWHAMHLELIARLYPDARVVNLIRDGRAVVRSLLTLPGGPATVADAATEWRETVNGGSRGRDLFGDRYFEVRYEDLLADPGRYSQALFGWLGLEVDPTLMEVVLSEAATKFNVDPGIPEIRADKWRDELSKADLEVIHSIAGPELKRLGYEVGAAPAGASTPGRLHELRRRLSSSAIQRTARDPASLIEGRMKKRMARSARAELHRNLGTVERFNELAIAGRGNDARALCDPSGWYKLVDDGEGAEGRGTGVLNQIVRAVAAHGKAGLRPTDSASHPSRRLFTLEMEYELAGGERWVQVAVYVVSNETITSIALYRFRRPSPRGPAI